MQLLIRKLPNGEVEIKVGTDEPCSREFLCEALAMLLTLVISFHQRNATETTGKIDYVR